MPRSISCQFCAEGHTVTRRRKWVLAEGHVKVDGVVYSACEYHQKFPPRDFLPNDPQPAARNPYGTTPDNDTEEDSGGHGPEFLKKRRWFREWKAQNTEAYDKFFELADELRRVGTKKTGAWLIISKMRWDHHFTTRGSDFKLPNEAIAFLARDYMRSAPERNAFFDIKTMTGEDFARTARECGMTRQMAA